MTGHLHLDDDPRVGAEPGTRPERAADACAAAGAERRSRS